MIALSYKCVCKISSQVQQHLYATFYDDQTQNWSVKFDSKDDAMEFTAQVSPLFV